MALRDSLIQQTEQAIDGLRKREQVLNTDLQQVQHELSEARAMLQLIKTGKAQNGDKPSRSTRQRLNQDEVLDIIADLPDTFTSVQLSDALGVVREQATLWGNRMVKAGILTVVYQGKVRDPRPTEWAKV